MSLCDCFDETIAWVLEQAHAANRASAESEEAGRTKEADRLYEDFHDYQQIVRLLEVGREMCR
jgi:hypothetical protein